MNGTLTSFKQWTGRNGQSGVRLDSVRGSCAAVTGRCVALAVDWYRNHNAVCRGLSLVKHRLCVSCDPSKMLVVDAGCSTPGSATPSLLDSPTLARVERARLRQEGAGNAGGVGVGGSSPLHHAACCQVNQHTFLVFVRCTCSDCDRLNGAVWMCITYITV